MLADLRIKTVDNISFIGIPLGDPAYFSASNWEISVSWGDGKRDIIKDTYDNPGVAWDRKFDSTGNPTASAPSTGCLTLWHAYQTRGKYEIRILGGFGTGTGSNKKNNKLAFAKAEDRGLNSTPTLIEEITYWKDNKSGFYMHGQGDFEDFSNLKAIGSKIVPLTSANPESAITYDDTGNGDLFCKNTFKNCINFTTRCAPLKVFQFNKNNIINLEGFFEGCSYNHSLPWRVNRVTNFKNLLKNSTRMRSFGTGWNFKNAENLEGAFQNSYFGTGKGFKLDQVSGLPVGQRYFKIIISESNNQNIIWCNDPEVHGEMTDSLKQNPHGGKPLTLTVNNAGVITDGSEVLGLGNGKNDFLPYNFDQIDGLDQYKMHVWHSDSAGGTYTKELETVGNPTLVRVQDEAFFYYLTDCKNAKNMMKDHKGFNSNFIKRWFYKSSKNCNMEGLFEGAVSEDTEAKGLPWIGAKPTSLKAFYRNTENNLPKLDNLNTSKTTSIAHMFEGSKYGTGNTADSALNSWDLQRCESMTYCFYNASFTGGIRDWFRKLSGDGKTFFDGIDAEGMFEGTCAYNGQSLLWGHFKPISTKRMFRQNKIFDKKIVGWDMTSCTDISSMFRDSIYNSDTISDWQLPLVKTAKHCFDGSKFTGEIRHWFSETTLQGTDFVIEDIAGMFEDCDHDGSGLKKWAKRMNHSVKFAMSFARNASNMKGEQLAKWFQQDNVLEKFDHFWDGAKELNNQAKSDIKLWKVPTECNSQFNVLKGQDYQGKIGTCNYKVYENDDLCVPQERYETPNAYVKSSAILPQVTFDADFLPVGIYDTAFFRINTQ